MKWIAERPELPKSGEVRLRAVFAWKPTRVGDFVVWLETYRLKETFFQPAGGHPGWWRETGREPLYWTIL